MVMPAAARRSRAATFASIGKVLSSATTRPGCGALSRLSTVASSAAMPGKLVRARAQPCAASPAEPQGASPAAASAAVLPASVSYPLTVKPAAMRFWAIAEPMMPSPTTATFFAGDDISPSPCPSPRGRGEGTPLRHLAQLSHDILGQSRCSPSPRERGEGRGEGQESSRLDRFAADVLAAAEHQGRLVGVGEAFDMADEDDVIAAIMAELVAALEMRRR